MSKAVSARVPVGGVTKVGRARFFKMAASWLPNIVLVVVLAVNLFPWLWTFNLGFRERHDILSPNPVWIFKPTLLNFIRGLFEERVWRFIVNSFVVALATTVLCLAVGVPAAYAFARFTIPGKEPLFFFILTIRMAPSIVVALPLYIMLSKVHLLGTHIGLILANTTFTLPFVIWLMRGFFDDVPTDIDAAAMTDGYTRFGAFLHAILPLVRSGIVAVALFSFIFSWNEFLFGLILTGSESRTLPVGIRGLIRPHGTLWGEVCAVSSIATIPVVILIFFLQRHLVRGLTFGAVKG